MRLRLVTASDATRIAEIYAPFVTDSWISFEELAPDANEIARRIASSTKMHPWLVAAVDGNVIGYAYATKHRERGAYRWSVDVSVYLDERFRRHGTARRLYNSLFTILVAQGYFNVLAGITLPNDASVAFHRSLGFTTLGIYGNVGYKLGVWRNTMWLERSLQPLVSPPPIPCSLVSLDARVVAEILAP